MTLSLASAYLTVTGFEDRTPGTTVDYPETVNPTDFIRDSNVYSKEINRNKPSTKGVDISLDAFERALDLLIEEHNEEDHLFLLTVIYYALLGSLLRPKGFNARKPYRDTLGNYVLDFLRQHDRITCVFKNHSLQVLTNIDDNIESKVFKNEEFRPEKLIDYLLG